MSEVQAMLAAGLVESDRLRELYARIEPELYRYPAIDPKSLRRAVDAALSGRQLPRRPSPSPCGPPPHSVPYASLPDARPVALHSR